MASKPLQMRTGERTKLQEVVTMYTDQIIDEKKPENKEPVKIGKNGKELKTARPQLIIEESVWNDFKLLASAKGSKVNALFGEIIKQEVENNRKAIDKYKELQNLIK